MRKKKWMAGIIGFLLFIIIVYVDSSRDRVEPEIYVADSWEDVKAFQYQKTPGLKRAEKLGLTRHYEDIKIDVPGTNRTLSIDEIWFTKDFSYLFYSIDLGEDGFNLTREHIEENFPELIISPGLVDNDQEIMLGSSRGRWSITEGIVYQNRLYHQIQFPEFLKRTDEGYERISSMEELILSGAMVRIGDENYELDDIRLPVHFDEHDEIVKTIDLNREVEVMGHTLTWEMLELGTTYNRLYFRFEPVEDRLGNRIKLVMNTDQGEIRDYSAGARIEQTEDGSYVIQTHPFNHWPNTIDLELKGVTMVGSDEFSFEVDTEPYKTFLNNSTDEVPEINRFLETIKNTDIFLNSTFREEDMGIFISYELPDHADVPYMKLVGGMPVHSDEVRDDTFSKIMFHIENEKGETPESGSRFADVENYGFYIEKEYIENSEKLFVEVSHLYYEIVTDWKGTFEIPEENHTN